MNDDDYSKIIDGIEESYDIAGENYYNLFHDDIDHHSYDQELLVDFVSTLPSKPTICDMGCGPGAQYGAYTAEKCISLHGVDISAKNIEIAKKRLPNINFEKADMGKTEYPDGYFDGIISFYSLFHVPKSRTQTVFREFHRILKPKGRVLIVTHKGDFCGTISEIWGHTELQLFANFHIEAEIYNPIMEVGFNDVEVFAHPAYYDFPKERLIAKGTKP